ncbi:MAG: 2Fe-2S iron-sulfur cluster-binding protein [Candidatus Sulfotelmatobacter sp.]
MTDRTVRFVIRRQATPQSEPFWEEFDLRWRPGMNVISGLMDIVMNPVDRTGKPTTPIIYDSNCLEEVCGSCAMRINGASHVVATGQNAGDAPLSVGPVCPNIHESQ